MVFLFQNDMIYFYIYCLQHYFEKYLDLVYLFLIFEDIIALNIYIGDKEFQQYENDNEINNNNNNNYNNYNYNYNYNIIIIIIIVII